MKSAFDTPVFITSLFPMPKDRNNPNVYQQINRLKRLYTHNGILFTLRKEILILATIWMNIENLIIEISLTQKDTYFIILLK